MTLSSSATISVRVSDADDLPPLFSPASRAVARVKENARVGEALTLTPEVKAFDGDEGIDVGLKLTIEDDEAAEMFEIKWVHEVFIWIVVVVVVVVVVIVVVVVDVVLFKDFHDFFPSHIQDISTHKLMLMLRKALDHEATKLHYVIFRVSYIGSLVLRIV